MPAACRLRRLVRLAAAVIAIAAGSAVQVRAEPARVGDGVARDPRRAMTYRLGTAARPFGWSTAIGDLNADGDPDYAIADRLFRRPSGFAYSLELVIGGVGSRSLVFDAPGDALTVSLRDVDHDRDLDIVVTTVVSRAIVGVWLNDGVGRFHRAAAQALPDASEPAAGSTATDRRSDAGIAESILPRPGDALISVLAWSAARRPASSVAAGDASRNRSVRPAGLRPRAPPIST